MNYVDQIASLGACPDALDWLREANHPTLQAAWAACPRADWMLWLVQTAVIYGVQNIDARACVAAACDIAETALPHVPAGEDRPRISIETARRWLADEVSEAELRRAYDAARAAAAAYAVTVTSAYAATNAAAYAASAANWAARDAADAACAATYTAAYAAVSGMGAYEATAAAAGAVARVVRAARHAVSSDTAACAAYADVVRRYFPQPPEIK